jgi:mRNA-degrading endonuclease toxin of MazEF toxin-antitoxin module
VSTVVCAPVYGEVLGLRTEVIIGIEEGVPRQSSIRGDFLTLMFKKKLTGFVATLSDGKQRDLKTALLEALQLGR